MSVGFVQVMVGVALATVSVPLPFAKSLALVDALTVNETLPAGVAEVVVIVRVAVFELSPLVKLTGLGEKLALAPLGNAVVIDNAAVKLPLEPIPEPRLTVIV